MDIWTASYETTITNDQGLIVFSGYLTPEDIVGFRRSGDELRSMSEKTVSEYCPENVKKLNEIVMEFKTRDSFVPTDVQNLTSKLKELSVGDSLKLTCADNKTELLISCGVEIEWKDSVGREVRIPESPTKSDIKNLGLESVRLIHEKVYTAHAKDINGSSIESSPLHALSFNKLFEMVSDTDKFRERFNDMQEWHSDVADMNCLGRSAIIQIFTDIHDINDAERPAPEYLVDKVIPIAALIKRARQEPTDTNESSGPGM
jgi:hypothetical protein